MLTIIYDVFVLLDSSVYLTDIERRLRNVPQELRDAQRLRVAELDLGSDHLHEGFRRFDDVTDLGDHRDDHPAPVALVERDEERGEVSLSGDELADRRVETLALAPVAEAVDEDLEGQAPGGTRGCLRVAAHVELDPRLVAFEQRDPRRTGIHGRSIGRERDVPAKSSKITHHHVATYLAGRIVGDGVQTRGPHGGDTEGDVEHAEQSQLHG